MTILPWAGLIICAVAAPAAATKHARLITDHGPVHVWWPDDYEHASAGVVVYVHGYFTDVDRAWRQHRLARQFAASGINAVFIACGAPTGPRDDVRWHRVSDLLAAVTDAITEELPARIAVVGHSGAHRTLAFWLEEEVVETIVLVDALYNEHTPYRDWFAADASRRLIVTAAHTQRQSDNLRAELDDTLVFDAFPSPKVGTLHGARDARFVYVRSQHDHMGLVTGGIALPMLLRAIDLPLVAKASRKAAIRAR